MELTPEERAKRKLELRPNEKTEQEPQAEAGEIRATRRRMEPQFPLTPEQRAKLALGLKPHDPMPHPKDLSPTMREELAKIDPKFRAQVMGLMGCLQHMQEKTLALSEKIQQNMSTAIERTQQTSFAQRAIIRRAEKGTLGQADLERARGIIDQQGRRGAIDPKQEGLHELVIQREELMGAAQDMHAILMSQMPEGEAPVDEQSKAIAFVDQEVAQQAGMTSQAVDQAWSGYRHSDMLRIQAIVDGQQAAALAQGATHRPQGR